MFQYRSWHSCLLAALDPRPGERVLDVCTGTGSVAFELAARGCVVSGIDISREMLLGAIRRLETRRFTGSCEGIRPPETRRGDRLWPPWGRARLESCANRSGFLESGANIQFVEGRAEDLPFPAGSFDAVSFTFLLRYVADPGQPVREMARVLRSGGRIAMLEFAVPEFTITRSLWRVYVSRVLPVLTRVASAGWPEVGGFLGGSIADFYRRYPLPNLLSDWAHAGFCNVRCRRLSFGSAIIVSGEKQ